MGEKETDESQLTTEINICACLYTGGARDTTRGDKITAHCIIELYTSHY